MDGLKNIETLVDDDNIWEVSLEQIAQFSFEFGIKALSYEETGAGKMLVGILVRTSDKVLDDGTYLTRSLIVNTIYSPVKEYKRLLIYNHVKKAVDYTDEDSDHHLEYTYVFAVTSYPNFLIKAAVKHIVKKLEGKI